MYFLETAAEGVLGQNALIPDKNLDSASLLFNFLNFVVDVVF